MENVSDNMTIGNTIYRKIHYKANRKNPISMPTRYRLPCAAQYMDMNQHLCYTLKNFIQTAQADGQ